MAPAYDGLECTARPLDRLPSTIKCRSKHFDRLWIKGRVRHIEVMDMPPRSATHRPNPTDTGDSRLSWSCLDEVSGNRDDIFALARGHHSGARQPFGPPALAQKAIVSAHTFCHCCAICM